MYLTDKLLVFCPLFKKTTPKVMKFFFINLFGGLGHDHVTNG